MKYLLIILYLFFFVSNSVLAQKQDESIDSSAYKPMDDFSLSLFPIGFYLPETGLAFGGAGICVFNIGKKKKWRKSQVQIGSAYTLKKQLLIFIPYELYFGDNLKATGEVGYYKYFFNFYGIGIHSKLEDLEFYYTDFPRIIVNPSRRINEKYFVGFQYRLDMFKLFNREKLLLDLDPIGIDGGVVSTLGLTFAYDTRDDIFYPSKGVFVNVLNENSGDILGSDYSYSSLTFDASYYKQIAKNHILAFNYYTGITVGESPFFAYYYISSGKKGRGFNDRRFIDKNINMLQLEYRYPIYKRFSGTVFTSVGTVGNTYAEAFTNDKKFSYGAGLRFQLSKKQKSNVRVDFANSYEGFQFYITIGEAF